MTVSAVTGAAPPCDSSSGTIRDIAEVMVIAKSWVGRVTVADQRPFGNFTLVTWLEIPANKKTV